MKRIFSCQFILMAFITLLIASCSTNDVDPLDVTDNNYEITDEAFGEYLFYLEAAGVKKVAITSGGSEIYKYYVDTVLSLRQTEALNLSKSANSISILVAAGLKTAEIKIKSVDGLQFFRNLTGITLTSNEVENIDLRRLTKLESINLNNNLIGSLDLTKNTGLTTLSYTASSRATETQQLTTIDLSNNTKLTSVNLSRHSGAPFPIPVEIYNQLTTKEGVKPEETVSNEYEITDEAFGEYLKYLNVAGVTEKTEEVSGSTVYKYIIDKEVAKTQTGLLNLSKSATSISTLEAANVRTAKTKIKNVDGLQFFINITGITLTSNEVESIDLTQLTKLESVNLNNNFIGTLDLTKNTELTTLSYTASSKATATQQLATIDLSKNTKLTSVDLTKHSGAPFPIPAAIYNQLTKKEGVVSQ